jgi:ADP-ribose pyrophosphatase YjhB (NUDIX family)
MRQSEAAVAVIRRKEEGETLWLAQWNPKWGAFHFVGGHKRPSESFRECVIREIGEELVLRYERDFRIESKAPMHIEFNAFSEGSRTDTHYIMELFGVDLVSEDACLNVDEGPQNRWLTASEIRGGRTGDARPISPTMKRLLETMTGCS